MTCIIGIETNEGVYIGGDIQGTSHNNKSTHTQPKVFTVGDAVMGFTSTYRFGQLLENNLQEPFSPPREKTYPWIVKTLVPEIIKCLKENHYDHGGVMLFAVNGELWTLQSDYSVLRTVDGFTSCGSGQEYAVSALYTALSGRSFYQDDNGATRYNLAGNEVRSLFDSTMQTVSHFCPTVGPSCKTLFNKS